MKTKFYSKNIIFGAILLLGVGFLIYSSPPLYSAENVLTDDIKGKSGSNVRLDEGVVDTPYGGIGRYQNYITYSEAIDNAAWSKSGGGTPTVNANAAAAPDGATTADEIVWVNPAASTETVNQSLGITGASKTYTISFWIKQGTTATVTNTRTRFVGTALIDLRVHSVPTNWERRSFTVTVGGGETGTLNFRFEQQSDHGAGRMLIWGVQIEESSTLGVYTKTTSTAVTASRGVVSNADLIVNGVFTPNTIGAHSVTGTLTFSGVTTDITTGTNEHLALMPNGTGNVGIGTTGPGAKLQIKGPDSGQIEVLRLESKAAAASQGPYITFWGQGTGGANNYYGAIGGNDDGSNNNGLLFKVANGAQTTLAGLTDAMVIKYNGSVGIGIGAATPVARLEVKNAGTNVEMRLTGPDANPETAAVSFIDTNNYIKTIYGSDVNIGSYHGLTLTASTNNGTSADHVLDIKKYNTYLVRIDNAGNVGIGTTAPIRPLNIFQNASPWINLRLSGTNGAIEFVDSAGTHYNWLVGAQYNISDAFEITASTVSGGTTYSTPVFLIKSTGNVGIGTTGPNDKLAIVGGGLLVNTNTIDANAKFAVRATNDFEGIAIKASDGPRIFFDEGTAGSETQTAFIGLQAADNAFVMRNWGGTGAQVLFSIQSGGGRATLDQYRITVLHNGNVGIGTTNPVTPLDVIGAIRSSSGLTVTAGTVSLPANSITDTMVSDTLTASNLVAGTGVVDSTEIVDDTIVNADINASAAILGTKISPNFGSQNIVTTGNVGIGTTVPSAKLHVYGGSSQDYILTESNGANINSFLAIKSWTSAGSQIGLRLLNNSSTEIGKICLIPNATNPEFIFMNEATTGVMTFYTNSTEWMRINSSGSIGIGTTSPEAKLDVAGPLRVNSAGDTGVAQDLVLTNIDASTIKSYGPLTVQSGGSNDNYNLTLKGTGTGKVYVDDDLEITGALNLPALSIPASGTVTFGGDTNIYRSAANTLKTDDTLNITGNLQVTGSGPHYVSSGNVGIGTTGPGNLLHIYGPANRMLRLQSTNNHGELEIDSPTNYNSGLILRENASDKFSLIYNSNITSGNRLADTFELYSSISSTPIIRVHQSAGTSLVIDSTGNVGIGTTAPTSRLQVNGDLKINQYITTALAGSNAIDLWNNGINFASYLRIGNALDNDNNDSGEYFSIVTNGGQSPLIYVSQTGGSGTSAMPLVAIGNDASPDASLEIINDGIGDSFLVQDTNDEDTTPFVIKSSGNVGIGTTNPGSKLHVVGQSRISGSSLARLTIEPEGATTNLWNVDNSAGALRIFREDYAASGGGANGAVKMTILNDGKVGIGTTNPGGKLEIVGGQLVLPNGDFGTPAGFIFRNTSGALDGGLYEANNNNFYFQFGDGDSMCWKNNAGATIASMGNDGTLYLQAGAAISPQNADSTTAFQIKTYSGRTPYVNFDSTNQRVGIGTTAPGANLAVTSSTVTGKAVSIDANSLDRGTALYVSHSGDPGSGGAGPDISYKLLEVIDNHSGAWAHNGTTSRVNFAETRTLTGAGAWTTETGVDFFRVSRSWVNNDNLDNFSVGGALMRLSSSDSEPGGAKVYDSSNILVLEQNSGATGECIGSVLKIIGKGTGNLIEVLDNTTPIFNIKDGGNVGIGTTNPGVKLEVAGGGTTLAGPVVVNGSFTVNTGPKSAAVPTSKGMRRLYSVEAADARFEDFGSARLVNGEVEIELDPLFLETVTISDEYPMIINLTLTSDSLGLYVAKKSNSSFVVKEIQGGKGSPTFDYRITAMRKGFEKQRLELVEETKSSGEKGNK